MRKFAYIWQAHNPARSSPLPPLSPLGESDVHTASALSYSSHTVAPAVGGAIPALLPVTVQRQETAWPGLLSCKVPADLRQRSKLKANDWSVLAA